MTEKIKQQVLEEIYDYLKEHIEDFDLEAQLALRKMDHCRAPLNSINSSLCRQMEDYMEEWLHNEIETDELLAVEKSKHEPSVFDIINGLGQFADRIKELAEKVREDRPDVAGYLDGAHSGIGKAYIYLNTYLEEL
ncbi:MAG: hypothetical protein PUK22_04650 [Bacteroides sp.]|nr:hypothetical protein [Bacteroides sp.]